MSPENLILFFVNFNGFDLLALERIQAVVRHESGCHWSVLFSKKMCFGF